MCERSRKWHALGAAFVFVTVSCGAVTTEGADRQPPPMGDASPAPDAAVDGSPSALPDVDGAAYVMKPCRVDADCGSRYLVCSMMDVFVSGKPATLPLCQVRYQLPCVIDSDCGPGFTCTTDGSVCTGSSCTPMPRCDTAYTLCESDADCIAEWSCYSPAGGIGPGTAPKACYPPFASFE